MALQDKDYLALTLIGEARGEPIEGIIGVANVIRNRVNASKKLFKDICLAPGQFSCWNQSDPNYGLLQKYINDLEQGNPITDVNIKQCLVVAEAVYNKDFKDNTLGAKNYVTINRYNLAKSRNDPTDKWICNMQPVITLGHHIFLV